MMKVLPYIGLFGTCGTSTWRDPFIARYQQNGINYFNPKVESWTPECADIEKRHLKSDQIILFPVTGETYGTGSLGETGFSALSVVLSIMERPNRYVVIMIEKDMDPKLKDENPVAWKESVRARKLVLAHLSELKHPNVFVVDSFDQMMELSLELYSVVNKVEDIYTKWRKTA
jgi:hypothetical protein